MADDQIIQVSYGNVRLTAPGPRPTSKPRREAIADWLRSARTLTLNLIVFASVLGLVFVTGRDLLRQPVIIEEIALPDALTRRGYTGVVTAHRIWDALQEIQTESETLKSQVQLLAESRQLDVVEPGTGLSLQSLTQMLRELLGLRQTRIAGEFICLTDTCDAVEMALRLRVFTGNGIAIVNLGAIGGQDFDAYLLATALKALEHIDPYTVASYLNRTDDRRPEAELIARRLIRNNDPSSPWAALLLGRIADVRGDHDEAIVWYERSTKIAESLGTEDFSDAYALNNIGVSLGSQKKTDEAIKMFEDATEIDPDYSYAWYNLGTQLKVKEEYDKANLAFERATVADPENALAWTEWGSGLGKLGRHEDAIEKFRRATDIDPESSYAWYYWGSGLGKLGRHEDAIAMFRRATELEPDNSVAWNAWAISLNAIKKTDGFDPCRWAGGPAADFLASADLRAEDWIARNGWIRASIETLSAPCTQGGG